MRVRLLTLSLVDRVLYALNLKTVAAVTEEADARRVAMIGDDSSIAEQTKRSRAFADEIASRL